ncbi:murein DD-endopeptidase MepM/ murein hydrolase activator NlpD [Aeromicrobium panaciterrae]|uniref:Murein DD-endopeptidase MepM/ murein hydrolase activator NlpD n=1 Tax=Aeromicrobium panaciterrae TaxID=363861 RepID=A0ABU1UQZ3_9ACTN|nr:peptidoglycan DD-metalloendopeptidase family protein [Aeromicrobium panaciterrae]MDR7087593.1 murein DD-endopeptidase MepM/ murein hydrolase activator NlpD [Aeromicrobium panaciterrae]
MIKSRRKSVLAILLAAAMTFAVSSPSVADRKSDLEAQQRAAKNAAKDAKKALDGSTKEYAAAVSALRGAQAMLDTAQNQLGKTRGQLAVAKQRDAQMQAKLLVSEANLDTAMAKLKKGELELEESEAIVEQFTVQNLQQGNRGLRAFGDLLRGEDPADFTDQMNLNDSVGDAQLATMQGLAATKVLLEVKRDEVQKLRDIIKKQRAEAAANLKRMAKLEKKAEQQRDSISGLVDAREGARHTAAVSKAEDEKRYREEVQERNRLEAELQALINKGGGSNPGGDGGGALSRPVNGPITSPYGMRVHPITHVYKLHDGTDFGASCGTPIKAAASGTIISQYYNGAYGNRIILNNGTMRGVNVVTTYNHLSRFAKSSGSHVSRGEVIGYVGSTGYSTGCHLHFMVLANGKTTNPAGWL